MSEDWGWEMRWSSTEYQHLLVILINRIGGLSSAATLGNDLIQNVWGRWGWQVRWLRSEYQHLPFINSIGSLRPAIRGIYLILYVSVIETWARAVIVVISNKDTKQNTLRYIFLSEAWVPAGTHAEPLSIHWKYTGEDLCGSFVASHFFAFYLRWISFALPLSPRSLCGRRGRFIQ